MIGIVKTSGAEVEIRAIAPVGDKGETMVLDTIGNWYYRDALSHLDGRELV